MKAHKWRWLIGLLLLLTVVIVVFRVISAPVHGRQVPVDRQLTPKPHVTAPTLPASNVQSNYFDLPLPAGYKPQAAQAVPGLLYSQTILKPSSFGSLLINISLKPLPEGGLAADSSYRLRQQTSRYHLTSQSVDGDTVQLANDTESAAIVAFWPHGGYLATISVSSGLGNPAADDNRQELKALQPLLTAWQWH
jgi:hypothetical protein